jgi:dTMP kinase
MIGMQMAKSVANRGFFISFEGGEGSGKSTQAKRLSAWLAQKGLPVVLSREPGGTPFGLQIRQLLLENTDPLEPRAELLLYEADRAHHVATKIQPALQQGTIVLCDRFCDSSIVYQGICRRLGEKQTLMLNRFATNGLFPDMVILLDIPEKDGFARVRARAGTLDRMEREGLSFHKKVRQGFLKLARKQASRYVVLDARQSESAIESAIQKHVSAKLKRRGLWKP